jgi:hypothetical protein
MTQSRVSSTDELSGCKTKRFVGFQRPLLTSLLPQNLPPPLLARAPAFIHHRSLIHGFDSLARERRHLPHHTLPNSEGSSRRSVMTAGFTWEKMHGWRQEKSMKGWRCREVGRSSTVVAAAAQRYRSSFANTNIVLFVLSFPVPMSLSFQPGPGQVFLVNIQPAVPLRTSSTAVQPARSGSTVLSPMYSMLCRFSQSWM